MKTTSNVFFKIIAVLLILTYQLTLAQPNYPTDPNNAQLIYSDVENFVEAFKNLQHATDTIAVLNQYYFERGSAGLKEYISKHSLTPKMLKDAISKDPDRYAKIPEFLAEKSSFKPEFTKTMQSFQQVIS